jgi:PAS domain S-box-containing protein
MSESDRRSSASSPDTGSAPDPVDRVAGTDFTGLPISQELISQWQQTVDLLARVTGAPVVMLSVRGCERQTGLLLHNAGCPLQPRDTGEAQRPSPIFCSHVIEEQQELYLPDATEHPDYQYSHLAKQGLVSYYGVPVVWPTGQAFGAVCVLADHIDAFPLQLRRVVQQFRRLIEEDLEMLARQAGVPNLDQPLRERDQLLRSMIELSPDAIFVTDGDQIILTNAFGIRLLKAQSLNEVLGKPITDIIPVTQREAFSHYLEQLLSDRSTHVDFAERTIQAVDGTIIPVDAAGSRVSYKGRAAVQIVARDLSWRKQAEQQLRQYQRIVSATPDLVALIDRRYVYQLVNEACLEAWALPWDGIVGHSIAEFFSSREFQAEIKPRLERCFKGETVRFQQWFEYPGRGRCFMSVTLTPFVDDDGAITGVVSAARDISDIKQIEDRLRRSEDRFRTVADSAIDWDYWLDPDGHLEYMSPSCKAITGYAVEDFLRRSDLLDSIVDPADANLHSGMDCATLGQQEAVTSEFRIRTADRRTRWIHHTCRPIYADDGRFLGRRATNRDITQRKNAEQALADSEQRYRDLAEQAPVPILETDCDGRILYLNRKACETFLLARRDIDDGITAFDLLAEHDRDRARERFSMNALGQSAPPAEYTGLRSDGTTVALLVHSRPICHNDTFIGLRAIAIDITERLRVEMDLARSRATLVHAQKLARLGSWTHDLITNSVSWSDEMYRIFGRDPATFRPTTDVFWEQMHPEDRPLVEDVIERMIGSHRPQDVEFRIIRPGGDERIVHGRTDIRLGAEGAPVELIGSLLDITEDRHRERMVHESAVKMRAILDSVDSALVLVDQYGYVLAFNENARRRARKTFDRELAEKTPMLDYVRQTDRESFLTNFSQAARGEPVTFDRRSYDGDGQSRWHTVRYRPVMDDSNDVIAVLFSVTDITDRKKAELAVKRSEDTLRQVVDLVPHDIYALDDTGRFIMANKTFAEGIGLVPDDVVGQHLADVFPGYDAAERWTTDAEADSQIIRSGQPRFIPELLQIASDGRKRWMQVSKVPFDHFGRPAVLTVAVDITDRKMAETAQRESEAKVQSILTAAPIGIGMTIDRDILWASDRLLATLQYSDDELLGKNARLLYPSQEEYDRVGREKYADIDRHGWGEIITKWVRKDGRVIDILLRSAPIDKHDLSKGVIFTALDITERKKAEDALRYSENRYRELVERMESGVVVFEVVDDGEDFIYKEINRAAEVIGGVSQGNVIGRRLLELRPQLADSALAESLRKVWRTGLPQSVPLTHYDGSNNEAWVEGHVYRLGTADLVFIFDDVTERIRVFEELSKADKLESIGVLAGGIAHDFNNVLTGVVGNISLLKSMVEHEHEGYPLLEEAEKAAMRARSLTQQLLTFSQGGSPVLTTTSIASVIRECTEFVLHGSNVACEFDLADDLALIEADEGQISQVIANMVINANQAMVYGGTVRVSAHNVDVAEDQFPSLAAGRYVCLSISDTGEGITPEHLARIFDPFFTTRDIGRGLGLATCYAIVRKHDGHIEVESTPGKGTSFRVFLPASEMNREECTVSLYNLRNGVGRVLVVDDEQAIRRVAATTLRQIGYRVEVTESGEAAVNAYAQALEAGERFDAVLLDLTMPGGIDGKETLERLRQLDPHVKAIVSSGYSTDPVMADCTAYGFVASIIKPYTFSKLGDTVARVLGSNQE